MNEIITLTLAWLAGGILGAFFFGGLWWTVRKGIGSQRAPLWFSVSLLVRMGVAVAGFAVIGHGHWERLVACLLGFFMARLIVMRLTRTTRNSTCLTQEVCHASEPR